MYRLFSVLVFGVILFTTSSYAQLGIEELAQRLIALEGKVQSGLDGLTQRVGALEGTVQGLSQRVNSANFHCFSKSTDFQWGADEPIVYLDRQDVQCEYPYSLTRMKLQRGGHDNDQVRYDYTCCKFVL